MPTCPGVPTNPIQESQGTWSPHSQSHWVPLLPQYHCRRHSCTADCPTHRRHFPPSQKFQAAVTTQCYSQCYTKSIKTRQQKVHTTLKHPLRRMDDSKHWKFQQKIYPKNVSRGIRRYYPVMYGNPSCREPTPKSSTTSFYMTPTWRYLWIVKE